jgi:hypothetical protein
MMMMMDDDLGDELLIRKFALPSLSTSVSNYLGLACLPSACCDWYSKAGRSFHSSVEFHMTVIEDFPRYLEVYERFSRMRAHEKSCLPACLPLSAFFSRSGMHMRLGLLYELAFFPCRRHSTRFWFFETLQLAYSSTYSSLPFLGLARRDSCEISWYIL